MRFSAEGGYDPLSGMLLCYGATAAEVQRKPGDDQMVNALGAFAAQVAVRQIQAKGTPEDFEAALTRARTSALSGPGLAEAKAGLQACLGLLKKPPP
jgi:hypothetical protein